MYWVSAMEVQPAGPPSFQSEEFRASRAGNLHDGGEAVMLLLRMMLLQPLVLHQLMHHVLAPPARTGPMGSGRGSSVSQSGPSVLHAALWPRVQLIQALGSGGRCSDESRLAA